LSPGLEGILRLVKAQFTAKDRDLVLELNHHGEAITLGQGVAGVGNARYHRAAGLPTRPERFCCSCRNPTRRLSSAECEHAGLYHG
jgi:hypothetical protein